MSYILLHINEFSYLLFSGGLRAQKTRFVDLSANEDPIEIFRLSGYVKYSSPESYMLCCTKTTVSDTRKLSDNVEELRLQMEEVSEFIPLTSQAKILLQPVLQRTRLNVSEPRFESLWHKFVDEEILSERKSAAVKFVGLFGCEEIKRVNWEPPSNLYSFMLKDLGTGLNEIERRFESSELGVFEFCVRFAHEHDAVWRRDEPSYANLKKVRIDELAGKKLALYSFLRSPRVCIALREFENESIARFGYSPFSLVPFFEFYRTHSRANGINFEQVRSTIELLLSYGRIDDASDYAHLVGYWLGLDEVVPATYFIQNIQFPMFNSDFSPPYPKSENLNVSPPNAVEDLFTLKEEAQTKPTDLLANIEPSVNAQGEIFTTVVDKRNIEVDESQAAQDSSLTSLNDKDQTISIPAEEAAAQPIRHEISASDSSLDASDCTPIDPAQQSSSPNVGETAVINAPSDHHKRSAKHSRGPKIKIADLNSDSSQSPVGRESGPSNEAFDAPNPTAAISNKPEKSRGKNSRKVEKK